MLTLPFLVWIEGNFCVCVWDCAKASPMFLAIAKWEQQDLMCTQNLMENVTSACLMGSLSTGQSRCSSYLQQPIRTDSLASPYLHHLPHSPKKKFENMLFLWNKGTLIGNKPLSNFGTSGARWSTVADEI